MFNNFYLPAIYSSYSHFIPLHQGFSVIQSCQNLQNLENNFFNPSVKSYTTKQISIKQEVIILKKQEDFVEKSQKSTKSVEITQKKQNKSIFHNYQKHLITTIKQKITITQLSLQFPSNQCVKDLWLAFNKCKIANRTLLLAIFGDKNTKNEELVNSLKRCYLSNILQKYSIQEIKQGQEMIRGVVIQYFRGKSLERELGGRKLRNEQKGVFQQYVQFFLSELGEGVLNRRLPKRYKREMVL